MGTPNLIWHWDGTSWKNAGGSAPAASLRSVWANSRTDVWAVGDGAVTLHGDGTSWTTMQAAGGVDSIYYGVWSGGAGDTWTVGFDLQSQPAVDRWSGSAWANALSGLASPPIVVTGSGATSVWVGGGANDVVRHWDGLSWTALPNAPNFVDSLWAASPTQLWAGGWGYSLCEWDGASWTTVHREAQGSATLASVWGTGPSDVWAVGTGGKVLHWDGTAATSFTIAPTDTDFGAIWGSGPDDVWAIGEQPVGWKQDAAVGYVWHVEHWDGTAWSEVATP